MCVCVLACSIGASSVAEESKHELFILSNSALSKEPHSFCCQIYIFNFVSFLEQPK